MFISKTPYRVSFFGGGTDLPHWAMKYGGMVISTTIDKFCYISCRELLPFFPYKHRLVYSQTETVDTIPQIKHPGMRGVFDFLDVKNSLEIHHDGDLPARSGLGSSSSFTVGLLNVIRSMSGEKPTSFDLAQDAIYVEQQINNEVVGSQDQVAASHGGFNKIIFSVDGSFTVSPITIDVSVQTELNDHLLLFYSGLQRKAPTIESAKVTNIEKKENEFREMMRLAVEAESILISENFEPKQLGELLHYGWSLKRSLSEKVSNSHIDDMYKAGLDAGALGGKVLGAGGGGFVLFLADPSKHKSIKMALSKFVPVEFKFESSGSKVYQLS